MTSPMRPTTSNDPITQREVAEDQRFYLGQAQEEADLAQNHEGTRLAILDSEPSRISN